MEKKENSLYYNLDDPKGFGGAKDFDKNWLEAQPTYTLHKPFRKRFPTRKYKVSGVNELWQMDLMEMIPYASVNKGNRYILTCIDVFSRFARAVPVKRKNGIVMRDAIWNLIKDVKPIHVQTDAGKEFYNVHVQKLFQDNNINHYTVFSQYKAAIVERFNRTLREKLTRYFTYTNKKVWVHVLGRIIKTYNKTPHRGIGGRKPEDISNTYEFWHNNYKTTPSFQKGTSIKINDYVRISRISQSPFKKNFDQNWSEEVFHVIAIDRKERPTMFILEDLKGETLKGKFYKQELQRVTKPDIFRIEKIIKTKGSGKYKQHYVKWHGYPEKFNSWIYASHINK